MIRMFGSAAGDDKVSGGRFGAGGFLAALLLLTCAPTLSAGLITYQLTNVMTAEGTAVTGSFLFGDNGDSFLLVRLPISLVADADPSFPGRASPALNFSVLNFVTLDGKEFNVWDSTNGYHIDIHFTDPLGGASDTIASATISKDSTDFSTTLTGSVTTGTPEPSSAALMLLGAAALFGGERFRKYRLANRS